MTMVAFVLYQDMKFDCWIVLIYDQVKIEPLVGAHVWRHFTPRLDHTSK